MENPEGKQVGAEGEKKSQGLYTVLISSTYVSIFLIQVHKVLIWRENILFGTLFLKPEIYIWISILARKPFKQKIFNAYKALIQKGK